jgi:hypothetical protein
MAYPTFATAMLSLHQQTSTVALVYQGELACSEVAHFLDWKSLGQISSLCSQKNKAPIDGSPGQYALVSVRRPVGDRSYHFHVLFSGMGPLAKLGKRGLVTHEYLGELGKKIKQLGSRKWFISRTEFAGLDAKYLIEGLGDCGPAEIVIVE